ncbi:hypothetical protein GQ600_22473 [Phytophthora cactorum]|nr:hypothetical protein GQ600_22473 [Phytophthora cactorum]
MADSSIASCYLRWDSFTRQTFRSQFKVYFVYFVAVFVATYVRCMEVLFSRNLRSTVRFQVFARRLPRYTKHTENVEAFACTFGTDGIGSTWCRSPVRGRNTPPVFRKLTTHLPAGWQALIMTTSFHYSKEIQLPHHANEHCGTTNLREMDSIRARHEGTWAVCSYDCKGIKLNGPFTKRIYWPI